MSTLHDKVSGGVKFHIEKFDSAMEVAEKCRTREITDSSFNNMADPSQITSWNGVKSYQEALDLMRNGYQPTVDSLRGIFKANRNGEGTRFTFQNEIQGFAPIVPLALKGIPNSMINMRMTPIKAKVLDVYYDITSHCGVGSEQIIEAGRTFLGTIIELERQGYRFNLYAVQTYAGTSDADMLIIRVKNASQPLDLKRVSFPLTHTGFFRVIGFDWYSKVPGGKYRGGYGQAMSVRFGKNEAKKKAQGLFGKNALYLTAEEIIKSGKDYVKLEVENGNCKN